VAESGRHEGDRRPVVDCVAGMGVQGRNCPLSIGVAARVWLLLGTDRCFVPPAGMARYRLTGRSVPIRTWER
jgi:hypothetical protein